MKLLIKDSLISGKGSFAPQKIKAGRKILVFQGDLVNEKEMWERIASGLERLDDPLQIADDMFLDLNTDSLYINHSCEPNTALTGQIDLIAIKDIQQNEEITFDYSSTDGINDTWQMNCNCGSNNCRRIIGNALTIPKTQIKKYYTAGGLQNFIRRQLKLK